MKKLLFSVVLISTFAFSQDPTRFADEVEAIQKKYDTLWDASKETIVFTGSSSVRIWKDLQERFPEHQIVNSGFGGSQASDLLYYSEEFILRFRPKKVFIYEGDNDVSEGKKSKEIMSDISEIISKIRAQDATTEIVLIAAKPSIARWSLKKDFKRLNRKFRKLSRRDVQMNYADVWKPMLSRRKVKEDIFIEDGLHMNAKGYEIWYETLKPYLE
mgnify:FL=1